MGSTVVVKFDDVFTVFLLALGAWCALSAWRKSFPTDKQILNAQEVLENHLRQHWLPDHPGGLQAYIYKRLMRNWYGQIIAQVRYDQKRARAIRRDWIEYMELLRRNATNAFLHVTSKTPFQGRHYNEMLYGSSRAQAIEDAFAALIGSDAKLELQSARENSDLDFDLEGDAMKP